VAVAPTSSRRQVVRPRGALTSASADLLLDLLRSLAPAPAQVEIDLSRVTRVDRSGAVLVLDAYVATLLRGGAFALSGPTPACRRSLERFGVLDVVELIGPGCLGHGRRRLS
jgi:anti-anti-sigma regulatory factor